VPSCKTTATGTLKAWEMSTEKSDSSELVMATAIKPTIIDGIRILLGFGSSPLFWSIFSSSPHPKTLETRVVELGILVERLCLNMHK
jgi:hypothetical protein